MMPTESHVDLSVLIVNYNTGPFLERFVLSLRERSMNTLAIEIVVVDCASPIDQAPWLDSVHGLGARVIRLTQNRGFAGGLRVAIGASSGKTLLLCNADLLAVDPLLEPIHERLLNKPEVGAIAPRAFLDPQCLFAIPDFRMLTRSELCREWGTELSGRIASRVARSRTRSRIAFWQSEQPTTHENLHGACIGIRRELLESVGGLDPDYPLYYEDTDLFRRLRSRDLLLESLPNPRVVHFIHRSSGTVWQDAMHKLAHGRRRFLRQHIGRGTATVDRMVRGLAARRSVLRWRTTECTELQPSDQPPTIHWPRNVSRVLIECAFDPHFLEAAGHRTSGDKFVMAWSTWAALAPGRYFLRAIDLTDDLQELGRWILTRPDGVTRL